jgi:malic enzyme
METKTPVLIVGCGGAGLAASMLLSKLGIEHIHAEEPCGLHGDDGYDDFQEKMAEYFKSSNKHRPTVPETAAYSRAKNIAAVIFPEGEILQHSMSG